ncbi:TrmH family RNA methyltransferase [Adlercreutzia equolifaciens]|uniref:TrmH family RNA methyltransferase n=1 Tax=Adlercreutzia equolifaciens TaxID=446660 RepID=UPI003D18D5BA
MTDGELRDPKQLLGLARAIDPTAPAGSLAQGLFVAESVNVIQRALDAGYLPFAVLTDERWLHASEALIEGLRAANPSLPVAVVSTNEMCSITGYETTRGPLAAFHRKPLPAVAEVLAGAHRVAILEDITNYTNIGAIFRSAAALAIDAVLLTPSCHDPLYRRASRVSMGTVFQVPWTRIGSSRAWTDEGLPQLREASFATAALALRDDSLPLQAPSLKAIDKLALVLGTEGDGLASATIAHCDYTVRIPMAHGVDSLNVAAASAVAFWELRWERG